MNYFVTGATGFIGRHVVAELLKRDATIYVLVRDGSRGKAESLIGRIGASEGRIVPIAGDLSKPGLGVVGFSERIAGGRHGEDPDDRSFGRSGRPQRPLGFRPIVRPSGDVPLLPQLLQQDPVAEPGAR